MTSSVLGTACAERDAFIVPELPADIDFVGVVYQGPDGEWAGSGLTRSSAAPPEVSIRLFGEPYDRIHVVGFRESDLRAWTDISAEELAEQPLEAPGPMRVPVRSSYSTSATLAEEPLRFEASEPPLDVSAYWAGSCPRIATETERAVEHNCSAWPCPAVMRQDGCKMSIQQVGNDCAFRFEAQLPATGTFSVRRTLTAGDQICEGELEADGDLAILCPPETGERSPCELRVAALPDAPTLEVSTRELLPPNAAPRLSPDLFLGMILDEESLTTFRHMPDAPFDCDEGDAPQSELVRLSLPELEPVFTSTLPPHVRVLAPSTREGELFAVLSGFPPRVARLSLEGRKLEDRPLGSELEWRPEDPTLDLPCPAPFEFLLDPSAERIVVFVRRPTKIDDSEVGVFVVDPTTLEFQRVAGTFGRNTGAPWSEAPGVVGFLKDGDELMKIRLMTSSGPASDQPRVDVFGGLPAVGRRALLWPEESVLLISSPASDRIDGLVLSALDGTQVEYRAFWEALRVPFALTRLPSHPGLALVALDNYGWDATLALFDVAAKRFSSPSLSVGGGRIGQLAVHEPSGDVYAFSPMDARILRVRIQTPP